MSWVIAISNQKGGVGKTTTCVSLGASLAASGYRTLIVDLDAQANLTMSVNIDPDTLDWSMPDLLNIDGPEQPPLISQVIQKTTVEGLDILPSDLRLAAVENQVFVKQNYEYLLSEILTACKPDYQFILIDCPPSLGAYTVMALTAAHFVLVPVQCEFFSARGLMRLLEVIEAVRGHTNPDLNYRFLVTLFDKRNRITQEVYAELTKSFESHFFETMITIDTKIRESAVAGEPVVKYAPRARSSESYRALAREILLYLEAEGK